MITLIGLGLWDEKDITQRGLEKIKTSDVTYLESYTSKLPGTTKKNLEKYIDKDIQYADREFIESGQIINYAKVNDVALLVPGDPLVATTHTDLIIRAEENDVKTDVVHNASIQSAISTTGLQSYKFGKTATVTFWEDNYKPSSFYEAIKENKKRGLHTLLLLDINIKENRYLKAKEAIRNLLEIEKEKKEKVFTRNTEIVTVSRIGSPKQKIKYGETGKLIKQNLGPPLHSIVVPGKLHEREKKYLEKYRIKSDSNE